jgi:hypothetical protein
MSFSPFGPPADYWHENQQQPQTGAIGVVKPTNRKGDAGKKHGERVKPGQKLKTDSCGQQSPRLPRRSHCTARTSRYQCIVSSQVDIDSRRLTLWLWNIKTLKNIFEAMQPQLDLIAA